MTSGVIGVPMGSYISQSLIKRYPRIDPILCAIGLILSAPFLAGAIILVSASSVAAYTLVFIGELALNLNWAIVADILLVRKKLKKFVYFLFFLFSFFFYLFQNFIKRWSKGWCEEWEGVFYSFWHLFFRTFHLLFGTFCLTYFN